MLNLLPTNQSDDVKAINIGSSYVSGLVFIISFFEFQGIILLDQLFLEWISAKIYNTYVIIFWNEMNE